MMTAQTLPTCLGDGLVTALVGVEEHRSPGGVFLADERDPAALQGSGVGRDDPRAAGHHAGATIADHGIKGHEVSPSTRKLRQERCAPWCRAFAPARGAERN